MYKNRMLAKIKMSKLVLAILKTGFGALVTLIFVIITGKIVAHNMGAAGIGLFFLIRQSIVTLTFVAAGMQPGLVQSVASSNESERAKLISNVFCIQSICSLFVILLVCCFLVTQVGSELVENRGISITTIICFLATIIASNLYFYVKSILNGIRAIGQLSLTEAVGPGLTALLIYPCTKYMSVDLTTSIVATFLASQVVMLVVALHFLKKAEIKLLKMERLSLIVSGIRSHAPTCAFIKISVLAIAASFFRSSLGYKCFICDALT
jgi:O-antigen/teichoic acid export membrane protein